MQKINKPVAFPATAQILGVAEQLLDLGPNKYGSYRIILKGYI